jgi:hypothetical protein
MFVERMVAEGAMFSEMCVDICFALAIHKGAQGDLGGGGGGM